MKKRERAMTFIEVMVVSVLIFLMFYYIYKLLSPGFRVWRESDLKVTLQQNTLIAMNRLASELRDSNVYSVTLRDYGGYRGVSTLICFASALDKKGNLIFKEEAFAGELISNGEPEWQKFIIYYHDDRSQLRRYETGSYSSLRNPEGMDFAGEPVAVVQVDDMVGNSVVSKKIETLKIMYNPSEEEWKGFDIHITAYDENDRVREFSTCLQTSVEVKYDDFKLPKN